MSKKIIVIGAGISGLSTAYWLFKNGYDVTVIDKNNDPGGVMESYYENSFLFDRGPNSGLETSPLIKQLVEESGLQEDFLYANSKGNKRYILRNNTLHPLPMSPGAFLKTKLFSASAKGRLFTEPFRPGSKDGYYQSIAEFVKRRLGQEFLDYAINPFVAGVYAGKPENLSVKSAFPKLYALEENYGGLIVGTIRSIRERKKRAEVAKASAKMFSFKNGMQSLPKALAGILGDKVILNTSVTKVEKVNGRYTVSALSSNKEKKYECDILISAIPSYNAAVIFEDEKILSEHLNAIYYPPVLVLYLAYRKKDIGQPLDGFGFLIPEKEKKSFLGAIWSSVLFPGRSDEETATFTLFIGGARNPDVVNKDKALIFSTAIQEFSQIMKINTDPVYQTYRYWPKAIPQYNIGYIEHERFFDEFEKNNKGIILSGNYRGGISVGDCIKNSELVFEKVKSLINEG
jgi:protoporphyrinogen/coproporphyrinogen III oxidase